MLLLLLLLLLDVLWLDDVAALLVLDAELRLDLQDAVLVRRLALVDEVPALERLAAEAAHEAVAVVLVQLVGLVHRDAQAVAERLAAGGARGVGGRHIRPM